MTAVGNLHEILNLYLQGKLDPEERAEIEYRLKVEPRLAHYFNGLKTVNNLEKLGSMVTHLEAAVTGAEATTPSHYIWVFDRAENSFCKVALVTTVSSEILVVPLDVFRQPGHTAFAVHEGDGVKRVLCVPDDLNGKAQIAIFHYGNFSDITSLEISDKSTSVAEYLVESKNPLLITLNDGITVLKTKGGHIPDATLLLT